MITPQGLELISEFFIVQRMFEILKSTEYAIKSYPGIKTQTDGIKTNTGGP